jgi:sugar O-acyltransferase (sialic acid O-acetyltransferase NeuD family)
MTKPKKIMIIGAGGHGQVVADIYLLCEQKESMRLVGFIDDDESLIGNVFFDRPVLDKLSNLQKYSFDKILVAIGKNDIRQNVVNKIERQGIAFSQAIHPTSILAKNVEIGVGTTICAGAVINTGSRIGNHVILNTGCTVDHHNDIGDFVHIAPGCHLGGDVTIGEGTLIGIGALVLPQCSIGKGCTIGAGAVIIKNIPDYSVVVGNPGKIIRTIDKVETKF